MEELRKLLTQDDEDDVNQVDESQVNKLMTQLDKDGDGKIQYEEFLEIFS